MFSRFFSGKESEQTREGKRIEQLRNKYHQTLADIRQNGDGGYVLFVDGEWGPCAHAMEANADKWDQSKKVPSVFGDFTPPTYCRLQFFCAAILYKKGNEYKRLDWSFPWCIFRSDPKRPGHMKYNKDNIEDFITSHILGSLLELWVFLLDGASRIFAWGIWFDMLNPLNFFENLNSIDSHGKDVFFKFMIDHRLENFKQVLLNIGCYEEDGKLKLKCTGNEQFDKSQKPRRIFQNLAYLWKNSKLGIISKEEEKDEEKKDCMLTWYQLVDDMKGLSDFLSDAGYESSEFETQCNELTGKSLAVYNRKDVQLMINLFENYTENPTFTLANFNTKMMPSVYEELFHEQGTNIVFRWKNVHAEHYVLFLDHMKKSEIPHAQPSPDEGTPNLKRILTAKRQNKSGEGHQSRKGRSPHDDLIADRKQIRPDQMELANIYCVEVTKLSPPLHQTTETPSEQLSDAYCKHVL